MSCPIIFQLLSRNHHCRKSHILGALQRPNHSDWLDKLDYDNRGLLRTWSLLLFSLSKEPASTAKDKTSLLRVLGIIYHFSTLRFLLVPGDSRICFFPCSSEICISFSSSGVRRLLVCIEYWDLELFFLEELFSLLEFNHFFRLNLHLAHSKVTRHACLLIPKGWRRLRISPMSNGVGLQPLWPIPPACSGLLHFAIKIERCGELFGILNAVGFNRLWSVLDG